MTGIITAVFLNWQWRENKESKGDGERKRGLLEAWDTGRERELEIQR
jgi:hypothetical protein